MSSPAPIVITQQDHVFTTSLLVSERFGKLHKNVLQSIEIIIETCPDKHFNGLNFQPVNYTDKKGEQRPMYKITKDGFFMLAMGFTGKKAFLWKIAFINAFNRMEQLLNQALVTEHHSMLADLYARHPQWHLTRIYAQDGLSTAEIAKKQGKHPRNVQRMIARMKTSGIDCRPQPNQQQAA